MAHRKASCLCCSCCCVTRQLRDGAPGAATGKAVQERARVPAGVSRPAPPAPGACCFRVPLSRARQGRSLSLCCRLRSDVIVVSGTELTPTLQIFPVVQVSGAGEAAATHMHAVAEGQLRSAVPVRGAAGRAVPGRVGARRGARPPVGARRAPRRDRSQFAGCAAPPAKNCGRRRCGAPLWM